MDSGGEVILPGTAPLDELAGENAQSDVNNDSLGSVPTVSKDNNEILGSIAVPENIPITEEIIKVSTPTEDSSLVPEGSPAVNVEEEQVDHTRGPSIDSSEPEQVAERDSKTHQASADNHLN
jgi:hypothetical protein